MKRILIVESVHVQSNQNIIQKIINNLSKNVNHHKDRQKNHKEILKIVQTNITKNCLKRHEVHKVLIRPCLSWGQDPDRKFRYLLEAPLVPKCGSKAKNWISNDWLITCSMKPIWSNSYNVHCCCEFHFSCVSQLKADLYYN